jgi:uncharacterized protein YjbI with pentapeptide repeats
MSEAGRVSFVEGEAPVNPYSLLEAVNRQTASVRTAWLLFIALFAYLSIIVGSVTHRDLLLARDVTLPLLQVDIDLGRFFIAAPLVLLAGHVGILMTCVVLARKAMELDKALLMVEATDRRTHPLRLELGNFFIVQVIAGAERGRIINGLLHGVTWLTLIALPLVALLFIQLTFLPFHSEAITWLHRATVLADVAIIAAVGIFLFRPELSLFTALWRGAAERPATAAVTGVVLVTASLFSLFAATIPGKRLDWGVTEGFAAGTSRAADRGGGWLEGAARLARGGMPDSRVLGVFPRNLEVTDGDLVVDRSTTSGQPTLNLRGRDLRFARLDRTDLHHSDLSGASLDGASLVGADLRGVLIQCLDERAIARREPGAGQAERHGCASARGTDFARARLTDAKLEGLDLTRARLDDAEAGGVSFAHANLAGASLERANLERTNFRGGISMQGARMAKAVLRGADLTAADLTGADLTGIAAQGAVLERASLVGASLQDAELEGASFASANLIGANLAGASVRGGSLNEARIWRAVAPSSRSELVDLMGLRGDAPTAAEVQVLEGRLAALPDRRLGQKARERLAEIPTSGDSQDASGANAGLRSGWTEVERASLQDSPDARLGGQQLTGATSGSFGGQGSNASSGLHDGSAIPSSLIRGNDRRSRVTRHLAALACKPRWANGAVATGLALRAMSPAFNGDLIGFYDSVRRPECPASRTMNRRVMGQLSETAERLLGR